MSGSLHVWLLLGGLLGLGLAYDLATRRIPNWLVLAGLTAGIACNLFAVCWVGPSGTLANGFGPGGSLLGAVAGLSIMLPLYLLRAMGAGDAKLMAAVGAFLGPVQVAGAALLSFVAGGVLSLFVALATHSLPRVLDNLRLMTFVAVSGRSSGWSLRDVQTTGRLPYALAIAVGTGLQVWLAARGGWPFV